MRPALGHYYGGRTRLVRCWSGLPPYITGLNRSDEPVAESRECLDVPRVVSRIAQGRAQLLDGAVEPVLEVDEGVLRPQPSFELRSRHDVPRALEQDQENGER